jgi:hypothetical protein
MNIMKEIKVGQTVLIKYRNVKGVVIDKRKGSTNNFWLVYLFKEYPWASTFNISGQKRLYWSNESNLIIQDENINNIKINKGSLVYWKMSHCIAEVVHMENILADNIDDQKLVLIPTKKETYLYKTSPHTVNRKDVVVVSEKNDQNIFRHKRISERFSYLFEKGQAIVEYAIILAFVAAIGLYANDSGITTAVYNAIEPTEQELMRIDHRRDYDVTASILDIISIQSHRQYHEGNTNDKRDVIRGMIRSGWVDDNEDSQIEKIKELKNEVGATQWSYLNGMGKNYRETENGNGIYRGDVGLYWVTEELSMDMFTINSFVQKKNYSLELVLQYFYSEKTHKYYVIKSYVWVNQLDVENRIALGGLHKHWDKPQGIVMGNQDGYDTLKEAVEVYEALREENDGSIVFTS